MSPESVSMAPEMWECPNEYCTSRNGEPYSIKIPKREIDLIQAHLLEEIYKKLEEIESKRRSQDL